MGWTFPGNLLLDNRHFREPGWPWSGGGQGPARGGAMTVDDWASGATITGLPIPGQPDLVRMRADRHLRLQQHLEAQGLDGLVLLSSSSVAYASGVDGPGEDSGRAGLFRAVAVVV